MVYNYIKVVYNTNYLRTIVRITSRGDNMFLTAKSKEVKRTELLEKGVTMEIDGVIYIGIG